MSASVCKYEWISVAPMNLKLHLALKKYVTIGVT